MEKFLRSRVGGLGEIRARCRKDACVVEFDRVPQPVMRRVAKALAPLGYRVVGASFDPNGRRKYAADVSFERVARSR